MPARSTSARSREPGIRIGFVLFMWVYNLPACWRMAQEIKAAIGNGQVIHLARPVSAWPKSEQFIILPERAVEQNDVGSFECIVQFIVQIADGGRDKGGRARALVAELQCDAAGQ